MLFSEIYGKYYKAVSDIVSEAVLDTLTEKKIAEIVRREAFAESMLTIPDALKSKAWLLLTENLATPIRHLPNTPLTTAEKRWLKTLLLDPRIRLFDPPSNGLEDIEPLYDQDVFVYFDRYGDGDPYDDPDYVEHFHTVLSALREKKMLSVSYTGHRGKSHVWACLPCRLEYSPKDDKFRLLAKSLRNKLMTINLARMMSCAVCGSVPDENISTVLPQTDQCSVTMELTDERNALERAMLHFAHLRRETERFDENHYHITLYYDEDDETEILIRVLSFGPMVRVVSPDGFIELVRERLTKQFAAFFP